MKKRLIALLCVLLLLLPGCSLDLSDVADAAFATGIPRDESAGPVKEGELAVVFLDVGQGDCTLVQSAGESMLIDCGDIDTFSALEETLERYGIETLRYFVGTHDHSDHVGAAGALIRSMPVEEILHSPLQISGEGYDYNKMFSVAAEKGIPARALEAGDRFSLGQAQILVLSPSDCDPSNVNNSSIVLKITGGGCSFLIAADAERECEREMLRFGAELSADVLRVGHHGSATSTSYRFLRRVMPQYAVISVGAGNSYGHPAEAVLSRLSDCGATVYRTDVHGNVCFTASDGVLSVKTQYEKPAYPPERPDAEKEVYIGNRKSKVFHAPDCKNLPGEKNRVYFNSVEEAAQAGYSPCGNCNP